ncbi:MAG: hypothetical protein SCH68_05150 [Brevefilum sp.]|nr:hypothetical protein [Brevefilum sp.]
MLVEKRDAIDELSKVRRLISSLVSMLDDQCHCFEALQRIRHLESQLELVILYLIRRQLQESIASIEGKPAPNVQKDEMKHLVELFRIFCTLPVYYQQTLDKVKHE